MRARLNVGITLGLLLLAFATPSGAQTPAHFWSHGFGSTNIDESYAVAVDGSGNVYVTGSFALTVNFGGSDLVSAGGLDIFVAKYNASGVHQWSQRFGSTSIDEGRAIAVDASGNVFVTGYFSGTVNFGGVGLVTAGSTDIFVAKYNASGVHQWSQRFGSTSGDQGRGIAIDASGNVVVTGYFQGTADFGGGGLVGAGGHDIVVAKYNSSGVHQWSQRFGSSGPDEGFAVAVDASGNALLTGWFFGTVDFGGGNLVSLGSNEIFLAKYNSGGVHQWSKRFGSATSDIGFAVAVDGSGGVVVTGYFSGGVDFGGGILVSHGGSTDFFLAKYNSSGVHQWSKAFGGLSSEIGHGVTVDASGSVVVTGFFVGTVSFGGGDLTSAGLQDIFVAKYDANGVHDWSGRFGGTGDDDGIGLAADTSGNALVVGYYTGAVDFGGGSLTSAGVQEAFVAKYGPEPAAPRVTGIADVGNDQGRRVRIQFLHSGYDNAGTPLTVTRYEAYRRNDALPAMTESLASLSRERLLALGWVDAGSTQAHEEDGYIMDAPTDADSTIASGQHYSVFYMRAATAAPGTFFDSPIDSGYSVDNLAPGIPASFAYNAGLLSWGESSAKDFDYFSIYGSNTNSFGSATLVNYTTAQSLDVNASPYVFYFVTATDFSGNEGKPAKVNTLSGVGDSPKGYVLSISSYPNPFNPETTVRYTVPSRGRVTIEVFDARGAHVATLFDEERNAGAYVVKWDGRDDRTNFVGSGVYFVRASHPTGTKSYKMVLLK